MPSPFPGMDPYLEDPSIFPDLHDSFIAALREAINAKLPAPYYASIASRVWLVPCDLDDGRETFLEIHAGSGGDRLVTCIEMLSPTNKTPEAHGREPYLRKQAEVLRSKVHLVEIDLLRGGDPTTAVPAARARERAGQFDYHVSIHRFDRPMEFLVYPISIRKKLPAISIPLLPGDGAIKVELQPLLDHCYDAGLYGRRLRYREVVPTPPLSADTMKWVNEILASGALRSAD